jgi:hypothetical protein
MPFPLASDPLRAARCLPVERFPSLPRLRRPAERLVERLVVAQGRRAALERTHFDAPDDRRAIDAQQIGELQRRVDVVSPHPRRTGT